MALWLDINVEEKKYTCYSSSGPFTDLVKEVVEEIQGNYPPLRTNKVYLY